MKCKFCGAEYIAGSALCPKCGKPTEQTAELSSEFDEFTFICPQCGEEVFAEDPECPECGCIFDEYEPGDEAGDEEDEYDEVEVEEDEEIEVEEDEEDETEAAEQAVRKMDNPLSGWKINDKYTDTEYEQMAENFSNNTIEENVPVRKPAPAPQSYRIIDEEDLDTEYPEIAEAISDDETDDEYYEDEYISKTESIIGKLSVFNVIFSLLAHLCNISVFGYALIRTSFNFYILILFLLAAAVIFLGYYFFKFILNVGENIVAIRKNTERKK
jgi:hypothetical protein